MWDHTKEKVSKYDTKLARAQILELWVVWSHPFISIISLSTLTQSSYTC